MHRPKTIDSSEKYLFRSMFFVPGHVEKYIQKAVLLNTDAIILDVEDAVPATKKDLARRTIKTALEIGLLQNKQIIIRINELDNGEVLADLDHVLHKDVLGIMPSKVYSILDMAFFDEVLRQYEHKMDLVEGHFKLFPLIETLLALENINQIANSTDRIIGLAFGGEDYLKELGGMHGENDHTFDYPRTKIAVAAKAAGLQAIDTPYLDVHDIDGFTKREQKSRDLGFEGCLLIHPKQIDVAHICFSPTSEELIIAKRIYDSVNYAEEKGLNVALLDGVLIGPPMKKNAHKVLKKKQLIDSMSK